MYRFIDLSNNNRVSSFDAVKKAGIEGVWLKVSEGATFADPDFSSFARRARAAGLRVGGYHFAYPQHASSDAVGEARFFAAKLGKIQARDLRPVLDFEINPEHMSNADLEAWTRAFNREVAKLTGTLPLYYSYGSFLHPSKPVGAGLWLANYGRNDGKDFDVAPPPPWKKVAAHQFTSNGQIPGVDGRCDVSSARSLSPLLAHPIRGRLPRVRGGGGPLKSA